MPLHVNLYHEIQSQERARRRDPLRLTIIGLVVIGIGFVANYFVALGEAHIVGEHYATLQAQFSKLDPKAKAAKARQTELDDEISASDTMMKTVDGRFYWAPVLDQILKVVPRNVQLIHVAADAAGDKSPGVLTISGISSGVEPRKEAESLRQALGAKLGSEFLNVTSVFKFLDDSDEVAVLDGRRLATATFTIEIQLEPKPSATEPVPAARKLKLASAQ
jgi:hypothetical protein